MNRRVASRICRNLAELLLQQHSGRVHSVFDSAVNLITDQGLITLLAAGRELSPLSLTLEDIPTFAPLALTPGQPVRLGPAAITIDQRLDIDWSRAQPIDLSVNALTGLIPPPEPETSLAALATVISGSSKAADGLAPALCQLFPHQFPPLAPNVWSSFLAPRLEQLYQALTAGNLTACARLGPMLAGCGPGLTPSSDDFLTGVFAALLGAAAAGQMAHEKAAAMCLALAEGAIPKTGVISGSFLASGAKGCFSEGMLGVLAAFFAPHTSLLAERAAVVLRFGSTSGADSLSGLWFGLSAVNRIKGK